MVCIPNLVRTFQPAADESTWGNISGHVSSTDEAESLSLEGVKVLVDGYNLQLTKGTGIKTYGLSLIQALDRMGAKVDVLLSRNGYKANEILDEIIFFDNQSGNQNWLNLSKWVIKSLSPFYRAKRRKPFAGLVVKRGKYSDDFLRYAESFNLPQCYDLANGLYQKFQLTTKINVSEKIDLWHATYPLPMQVRGARKITTIHDLIPLRLPYATLDDKKVFYLKIRDALKDSEVIITVSENSKQDILRYFDVDPDKIFVTYQPIVQQIQQISDHLTWIQANPQAALSLSQNAHQIFLKHYALEHLLETIVPYHQQMLQQNGFIPSLSTLSNPLPSVQFLLRLTADTSGKLPDLLHQAAQQTYPNVGLILTKPAELTIDAPPIQASFPSPSSTAQPIPPALPSGMDSRRSMPITLPSLIPPAPSTLTTSTPLSPS